MHSVLKSQLAFLSLISQKLILNYVKLKSTTLNMFQNRDDGASSMMFVKLSDLNAADGLP